MKDRAGLVPLAVIAVVLAAQLLAPAGAEGRADDGGKVPDVVRARMLELVDESGQVRANLQVETGGEVVFRLRDKKGTVRVKLAASEDGSGLLLLDDRTEPAIHLLTGSRGTTVTLAGKGKEKRVLEP